MNDVGRLLPLARDTRLVLIEGARGGGGAFEATFCAAGAAVQSLHWRPDLQALLPGLRGGHPRLPEPGDGDLRGVPALLPLATSGAAEVMLIEDGARALGLRIAVDAGHGVREAELPALATADMVLFATARDRDAALEAVSRNGPGADQQRRFQIADRPARQLAAMGIGWYGKSAAAHPPPPRRVFYWAGLTARQPFNTGIQRVTRALGKALCRLDVEVVPVKWDGRTGRMAPLDDTEAAHLAKWDGPATRHWAHLPDDLAGEWLLLPEAAVSAVPRIERNAAAVARGHGMRVAAVFYDLIPNKMPGAYPHDTVAAFNRYYDGFAEVDVALPISWTSAADLGRYLAGSGLRIPPIVPCPLAADLRGAARGRMPGHQSDRSGPLRLLAVGTWEPRKNYPRLLRALPLARRLIGGRGVELTIVGRRADYADLDLEIGRLAADAGGVDLRSHVSDEDLLSLLRASHATVFASYEEGFGLPVLESLWHGVPCLCHDGSAMAETAPGGGTVAVNMLDEAAIAAGIARLAGEAGLLERLGMEAFARPLRSWDDYAREVLSALARTASADPG